MARNEFSVVVVGRASSGQSQFQLEVESVAQLVVGVQVLVAVLGERDAVNLANRCAHVAAGQAAGRSGRGRRRRTADVTLADATQRHRHSRHIHLMTAHAAAAAAAALLEGARITHCRTDMSTISQSAATLCGWQLWFITFRVSRRRREMYSGHARLCLSLVACPHYYADPDVTRGW